MNPELEVDTDELRLAATATAATADRVSTAAAGLPVTPVVPRWATADAAALAADAAGHQLALLGADLAETARRIRGAAADYELADARAVTRLRLAR
jgi:hypothetical protein